MFIYRIAKSNTLVCGWTEEDCGFDFHSIRYVVYGIGQREVMEVIRRITVDIQTRNYLVEHTGIDGKVYMISGYPVPSGYSFNKDERTELLRSIIYNTASRMKIPAANVAKMTGLITAVLESYGRKPYQPVVEGGLSERDIRYWSEVVNRYKDYFSAY